MGRCMTRFLLLTTAVVALAAPAQAADMPVKAPPAAVAVYSWTGCYIGGNVGYARADAHYEGTPNAAYIAGAFSPAEAAGQAATSQHALRPSGITAGGGAGCNVQNGAWLWGIEGDANFQNIRRNDFVVLPGAGGAPGTYSWQDDLRSQWFATFRGRLGVVAGSRHLFYVTGGGAIAEFRALKALDFPGAVGFRYEGSVSGARLGWVVGGGYEFAISGNWTVKAEYLHLDFGSRSALAPQNVANTPFAWNYNFRFREDVVRLGLNYRLGGPVVARY
jgi:opacity protein-like surface antigen